MSENNNEISSASVDSGVEKEKDFAHAKVQPTREVPPEETGLLPCPWCGILPVVGPLSLEHKGSAFAYVSCFNSDCPAQPTVNDGEQVTDDRGSDEYKRLAIAQWNRRSDATTASLLRENQERRELLRAWMMHFAGRMRTEDPLLLQQTRAALSGEKNKKTTIGDEFKRVFTPEVRAELGELRSETPACRGGKGNEETGDLIERRENEL